MTPTRSKAEIAEHRRRALAGELVRKVGGRAYTSDDCRALAREASAALAILAAKPEPPGLPRRYAGGPNA